MRSREPESRVIRDLVGCVFPNAIPDAVERVREGVSTWVYRIRLGSETFYLRVLPEPDASFAPEMLVHDLLYARGVHVPKVVYFEHRNERIERSIMITEEIPGTSIARLPVGEVNPATLFETGRELSMVNSVKVSGFGWIRRDVEAASSLQAEHATHRAFATEHLESDLGIMERSALSPSEIAAICEVVEKHSSWMGTEQARLAHGDFDTTPIFQHQGRYAGIIDFGEIRGADQWYDLGHFRMYDGGSLPVSLLAPLIEGYQTVTPLPADHQQRICFASLLIGVRTLARQLQKYPGSSLVQHAAAAIRRDLALLRE